MPFSENLIQNNDFVIGDDWIFERIYKGAPIGTDIDQVILTIKETEAQSDVQAAAQITITATPTSDGVITENGSAGQVSFKIKVPHAKTALMTARQYVMDFQMRFATGEKITREKRFIYPVGEVTQS